VLLTSVGPEPRRRPVKCKRERTSKRAFMVLLLLAGGVSPLGFWGSSLPFRDSLDASQFSELHLNPPTAKKLETPCTPRCI
jgi:hypothetical protein